MSLEEAIQVLSEQRHRGSDRWEVVEGLRYGAKVRPTYDAPSPTWLTDFEAIAIAEKYARHNNLLTDIAHMAEEGRSK